MDSVLRRMGGSEGLILARYGFTSAATACPSSMTAMA